MLEQAKKVNIPISGMKIGPNDFYRVEQRLALALYLQLKKQDYEQFVKESGNEEENKEFRQMDKRCFYLYGDKFDINLVIDRRVEDIIQNPLFYPEVLDFAKKVIERNDPALN